MPVSILIDKIANSIVEVRSNKSFDTEALPFARAEALKIHKKDGWKFNWKSESKDQDRQLFKLVIHGADDIQGLVSIEVMENYIEMHLIENAPANFGHEKAYAGCAGNLVAFACKISFDLGFDGFVSFRAKTELFDHYEQTLGAEKIFKDRMQIATDSGQKTRK